MLERRELGRTVATKLSLVIAGLVVVALGTLSAFSVWTSRQSLRREIQAGHLTAATLAARAVEQYMLDASAVVAEASGRPKLNQEIGSRNWPEVTRVLQHIVGNFSQFDYAFVMDPQGVLRARVPHADTVGRNFSFRDFYQEAIRTRRLYVSGVYVSQAAQRPVVTIAVPVFDRAGEITGVLGGALSLKALGQFASTIALDHDSVQLVDRAGRLIVRSGGPEAAVLANVSGQPPVRAALNGARGTMEFRDEGRGQTLLAAHAPISRFGWAVVVAQSTAVAYAPTETLGRRLLWLTAGFTLAAVLCAWGLARALTNPLVKLVEATKRLGAGDFSVRVVRKGRDELATLAAAFNTMAERLQGSYQELQQKTDEVTALNRELEQRVTERTAELHATNRELEAFVYSASHDLRAPLRSIDAFSRIVQEEAAAALSETARGHLGRVRGSAQQMARLIDDLLNFSRLGRQPLKTRSIDPAVVAREALEGLAPEREGRRIDTVIGDLPACEADPALLRHVFVNLLSNALKFTRPREVARVEVGATRTGAAPVYFVKDNGVGFDMRYAEKLFGVFQRLHLPEEYEGTGVGLAIVQRIVHRHRGRVWAESEPEAGAAFYFTLGGGDNGG